MQFFTQIGIDWRLLVAQIINFGILLWLLNKFLYKPVIKQIQEDERKRREVEEAQRSLEQEKELVRQETLQALTQAKEKSKLIITDAAKLAEELKNRTSLEQQKLSEKFAEQVKHETETLSALLRERITREEREAMTQSVVRALDKTLDSERKGAIEKMFFGRMLAAVQKSRFLKKQYGLPIRLEYANVLSKDDVALLEAVLQKKLHVDEVHIEKQRNQQLISGVSLQVAGMYFSQNLSELFEFK